MQISRLAVLSNIDPVVPTRSRLKDGVGSRGIGCRCVTAGLSDLRVFCARLSDLGLPSRALNALLEVSYVCGLVVEFSFGAEGIPMKSGVMSSGNRRP